MNLKERELLTIEFISNDTNYNAAIGGEGGPIFLGRKHSPETKEKIRKKSLGRKGPLHTKESLVQRTNTRFKNNNGIYNNFSEETRNRISVKLKEYYKDKKLKQIREEVISPVS